MTKEQSKLRRDFDKCKDSLEHAKKYHRSTKGLQKQLYQLRAAMMVSEMSKPEMKRAA